MDPPRRVRGELDRTPPNYQLVIKFLLMSSILAASTNLEGVPTGCGLLFGSESAGSKAKKANLSSNRMFDVERRVPEEARQPLQELGLEDWLQMTQRSRGRAFVTKVLSVLAFNSVFIWTDLGSTFLWRDPSNTVYPLSDLESSESVRKCPVLGPVLSAMSLEDPHCDQRCMRERDEVFTHANVTGIHQPYCIASEAIACGSFMTDDANINVDGGIHSAPGVSPNPWAAAARWAHLGDVGVPWWAQIVALALLVVAVLWVPRCTDVLELTCPVLVT